MFSNLSYVVLTWFLCTITTGETGDADGQKSGPSAQTPFLAGLETGRRHSLAVGTEGIVPTATVGTT